MTTVRALSNIGNYTYYLRKEGIGEWLGEGAARLGLVGEVDPQEFNSVRQGRHPSTDERLKPRYVPSRVYQKSWGEETHHAREAYDVVISAPKSVSIQALYDQRLVRAHSEAVKATAKEMESLAGRLVIAAYQHRNSRALDPQIHTHLLCANLAHGNRWLSLSAANFYKNTEYLTALYRQELFSRAERLGYTVKDAELAHVSPELREKFSKRTNERDEAIQRYKQQKNISRDLTQNEIASLVYWNRGSKDYSLTQDQIRIRQFQQFTPEEKAELRGAKEDAKERVRERKEERYQAQMPRWEKLLQERASPYLLEAVQAHGMTPYQASVIARAFPKEQHSIIVDLPFETRKDAINEAREKLQSGHPRIRPNDHVDYEPGLEREHWSYGQRISM